MIIAIDAMGGDAGAPMVLRGVRHALRHLEDVQFLLFGDETQLRRLIGSDKRLLGACEIVHAPKHITMDMPPAQAIRFGRKESSMGMAIQAVRDGKADCVLSAGNTGALMALATLILRTMAGISRPALAGLWPTERGQSVMLDLGATVQLSAEQYVQFAVLGEAYAKAQLGLANPSIGLLNIGSEDIKGTPLLRDAAQHLEATSLNFQGFVEGDGILAGDVDVIVTDGFTGNVALKTAEGTAKLIRGYLMTALRSSLLSRLGALLAFRAFRALRAQLSAPTGAILLGLNGIAVKSHGGVDEKGFATAIEISVQLTRAKLLEQIEGDMHSVAERLEGFLTSATASANSNEKKSAASS